ncbi:MAG: Phospholipase precursor [Pseudomonadota bacterium]|jgi:alkaline phosphatase D
MSLKLSRRNALKTLGLSFCTPLFSKLALASEQDWVLGFGSCMSQRRSQRFWDAILARHFNHWVFLGDNLYPDRDNLPSLQEAYSELARLEPLQRLIAKVPVSAVWDDHDFGADNADSRLPYREESQQLFRTFWRQEYTTQSDGIYSSRMFEHQGRKIHLILPDLRFHRTPYEPARVLGPGTPVQELDPQLLGAAQWEWLESELEKPADLKIIGSSIQVLSFEHNFEKWHNYPAEFERLMALVGRISTPTVFLSGDRHVHEISKVQLVSGRTLYDFTSSGLNKADGLSRFERNSLRVERSLDDGFGEVRVRWIDGVPRVSMSMIDSRGVERFTLADNLV